MPELSSYQDFLAGKITPVSTEIAVGQPKKRSEDLFTKIVQSLAKNQNNPGTKLGRTAIASSKESIFDQFAQQFPNDFKKNTQPDLDSKLPTNALNMTRAEEPERHQPNPDFTTFALHIEERVNRERSTKIIGNNEILPDPRNVSISNACREKLRKIFEKKLFRFFTPDLTKNETAGVLKLEFAKADGSSVENFVITDITVINTGDPDRVEVIDTPLKSGEIEFHTHTLPKFYGKIDIGDFETAIKGPNFVGKTQTSAIPESDQEKLFAILSISKDSETLDISVYSHKMSRVKKQDDGSYTLGLTQLKFVDNLEPVGH